MSARLQFGRHRLGEADQRGSWTRRRRPCLAAPFSAANAPTLTILPPPCSSMVRHDGARRVQQRARVEVEHALPGLVARSRAPLRPCGSRRPGGTARRRGRSAPRACATRARTCAAIEQVGRREQVGARRSSPNARCKRIALAVHQHQRARRAANAGATAAPSCPAAPVIMTVLPLSLMPMLPGVSRGVVAAGAAVQHPVASTARRPARMLGWPPSRARSTGAKSMCASASKSSRSSEHEVGLLEVVDAVAACASRARGRSPRGSARRLPRENSVSVADEAMPAP